MSTTKRHVDHKLTINFETKNILKIALVSQLAVFVVIGLDFTGLNVPILRQVICFIYLVFIPGILALRILGLHKMYTIEIFLYSIGISLFILMFAGFLMNVLYPLVGISNPISLMPLIVTTTIVTFVLCFISYLTNKNSIISFSIDTQQIFSPCVLFSLLLPFLSIFGAYLSNFHDNNLLLLILLAIISVIPVLVAFDKLPKGIYLLILWVTSISLLLHNSLISMYIGGGDSEVEYYFSNLVIINGFWDPAITNNMNAMLRTVILNPIFNILCDIELTWVFKIIHPLLYSVTPLVLYLAFKRVTNDKIAFFSCFFFYVYVSILHGSCKKRKNRDGRIFSCINSTFNIG